MATEPAKSSTSPSQTCVLASCVANVLTNRPRLYLSNLPDKLQKADLKRELYMLFSTYGSVLDIVAQKTVKMRGQAHIVFKDVPTAAQAMRQLEGFVFFGKPMVRFLSLSIRIALIGIENCVRKDQVRFYRET
jgi:RNA recognition motif-containing protein